MRGGSGGDCAGGADEYCQEKQTTLFQEVGWMNGLPTVQVLQIEKIMLAGKNGRFKHKSPHCKRLKNLDYC